MCRNDLATLGDFLDFLKWRRVHRGIPYSFHGVIPKLIPDAIPVIRFYSDKGRLYTVSRKAGQQAGQLYRIRMGSQLASTIPCCAFGDNKNTIITVCYGLAKKFNVRVETSAINVKVEVVDGMMSSLYNNGYVKESSVTRNGNNIIIS